MKTFFTANMKIIILIIFIHCLFLFSWLCIDTRPPQWDQAIHVMLSMKYADLFKNDLSYEKFILISNYYPPLYHCITAFWMLLFGMNTYCYAFTNILFLAVMLVSGYFLIKEISSEKHAVLTILLLSAFPFIHWLEKNALIDIAVASIFPVVYLFVYKSDFFIKRKYTVYAGISAGLAILIKWTFVIFLIPLFFIALYKHKSLLKPAKGLFLACFSCFITFIPWYATKIVSFLSQFPKSIHAGVREKDPEVLTVKSFLYYVQSLYEHHLGIIITLLFIVGLFIFLKNFKDKIIIWFTAFSILIPLILLSLYRNKDPRYIIGYFIFIAFISSFSLMKIYEKNRNLIILSIIVYTFYSYFIADKPYSGDWKIKKIFSDILKEHKPKALTISVIPDAAHCNESTFKWADAIINNDKTITIKDVKHLPFHSHFIVTKTGSQGASSSLNDINDFLNSELAHEKFSEYNLFNSYILPDNEMISVYKRKESPLDADKIKNLCNEIFSTSALNVNIIKKDDNEFTFIVSIEKGTITDKKNVIPIENSVFIFKNVTHIIPPYSLRSFLCSEIHVTATIVKDDIFKMLKKNVDSLSFENNCLTVSKKNLTISLAFSDVQYQRLTLSKLDIFYKQRKIPEIITDYLRSNIVTNLNNAGFPINFKHIEINDKGIYIH